MQTKTGVVHVGPNLAIATTVTFMGTWEKFVKKLVAFVVRDWVNIVPGEIYCERLDAVCRLLRLILHSCRSKFRCTNIAGKFIRLQKIIEHSFFRTLKNSAGNWLPKSFFVGHMTGGCRDKYYYCPSWVRRSPSACSMVFYQTRCPYSCDTCEEWKKLW